MKPQQDKDSEASRDKTTEHVRVHIDQEPYKSPNPTTGIDLYALAEVKEGLVLYREVTGNKEDPEIPNTDHRVHLEKDEHFHSGPPKHFKIFVNGRPKTVSERKLSFDAVVALAFNPVPTGENVLFTITYKDGPPGNPRGHLVDGQNVKIKEGMKFDVTATDKS